jgi:hypothetical protein
MDKSYKLLFKLQIKAFKTIFIFSNQKVEMMQAKSSGNQVTFKIKNRCKFKIWPGFIGKSKSNPKWPQPLGGGWELAAGKSTTLRVPKDLFASRIWARTNCTTKNGRFSCKTGDCGGSSVKCSGRSGATPATLAEFTLNGSGKKDYYDVSLVDGYNIQMSIKPTKPNRDETGKYWCKTTDCKRDLNSICPKELQKKVGKKVVGCLSACEKFKTDLYCCRGQHNKPETCRSSSWPTNYAAVFKRACPTAYSYAYDDSTSTFMCRNTDYEITFC